jgi:hypothetical protein
VAAADCEISGRAGDLYQALWNRRSYGDGIAVTGDGAVAELWRTASAVG